MGDIWAKIMEDPVYVSETLVRGVGAVGQPVHGTNTGGVSTKIWKLCS